ncbi:MAG: hypothetical protein QOE63_874 [Acidimicrobiaceae bacterium]
MILLAGGTGRLGSLVAHRLAERGERVRILTRDAARAAHLQDLPIEVAIGDVRHAATLTAALDGASVVVSAVHGFAGPGHVSPASVDRDGNANLIDAAVAAGAEVVLLSGVGATADSPLELFRMKHAAEVHLGASGVRATTVRPTAFAELWIELLRGTAGRSGRPLVFGRGNNPINFAAVVDVAVVVDEVTTDSSTRGTIIEVGGPRDLTFNELAAAVQRADGRTSAPRHVPPPMLAVMANTVGRLKRELGRQARAAIAMDVMDLTWSPDRVAAGVHARPGATTVDRLLQLQPQNVPFSTQ